MKIYHKESVYDAAIKRINWLFDEFPNIVVSVSGGKDSTVCFELTLQIARQRNRLPLNCLWIDQEGEWQSTVEMQRYMMHHPDVKPYWIQVPFRLFNAASTYDHWLKCWDKESKDLWIHPQDPVALTENVYGTDRFRNLFTKIRKYHFGHIPTANIGGVRGEESPRRLSGLTRDDTFKGATWAKVEDKELNHYTFYPLYDWSYTDIWKAIHDNNWRYNSLYDKLYQYGVPVTQMRVSNLHHETAVQNLFFIQELEPETYGRLTRRLAGIDMAGKMGVKDFFVPTTLPFMFSSWKEYRDYLCVNLIDQEWQERFARMFAVDDRDIGEELGDKKYKRHIRSILVNDWEGDSLKHYRSTGDYREILRNRRIAEGLRTPLVTS